MFDFSAPSRTADKKALTIQRKVRLIENTEGQEPIHLWPTSKESKGQVMFTTGEHKGYLEKIIRYVWLVHYINKHDLKTTARFSS